MQPSNEPMAPLSASAAKDAGAASAEKAQRGPAPTPAAPDPPVDQVGPDARATSAPPPAGMRAPPHAASPPARGRAAETEAEEVDVWWGSYSGWTMWPSMAVCVVLTALIALGEWLWVPRDLQQWVFVGLAGALWLAQGTRWAYRFFAINYRLTTRRLFRDSGFLHPEMVQISLKTVARIEVRRNALEKLARVGRLCVYLHDAQLPPLILEGVRHPEAVGQMIEEWRDHAMSAEQALNAGQAVTAEGPRQREIA